MIGILLGPDDAPVWFGSCRQFATGPEAKEAFERLFDHDERGALGVGIYRHQRVGLDSEAKLVSVVGLGEQGVLRAEELLGGEETELHPETWHELIRRRLEVVATMNGAHLPAGRYRIGHSKGGDRLG